MVTDNELNVPLSGTLFVAFACPVEYGAYAYCLPLVSWYGGTALLWTICSNAALD